MLGESICTVKCETIDLDVPADAEIVLEGEIAPGNQLEPEGPFGETGLYPDAGTAHVFNIKAITRRRDHLLRAALRLSRATDTQATTGLGIEVAPSSTCARWTAGVDCSTFACWRYRD